MTDLNTALGAEPSSSTPEASGTLATPETANASPETPALAPIGFDPNPSESEQPEPAQESTWDLKLDPTTVIAVGADGKPITAADVQAGHLRQSDYTRKTQELAQQRQELATAAEWYQQASPVLEALASDDVNVRRETIMALAREVGVDLGGGPSRDERGRFASTQEPTQAQAPGLIDLEEFEEGSAGWQLANMVNHLNGQLSAITQAQSQREAEAQQAQLRGQIDAIASDWASKGLTTADRDAALALVGKTITPEQAMWLANREALLRHTASLGLKSGTQVKQAPEEPGNGRPVVGAAGRSFNDLLANPLVR